jgi:hypothetical protein
MRARRDGVTGRDAMTPSEQRLARRLAAEADVRRRCAPHQLRHASLRTTSIYLQGIDTEEIIAAVSAMLGMFML